MTGGVLYLSYDGMLEPLGQSQVLRYLERLAPAFPIVLISFEKPDDWDQVERREALRAHLRESRIVWIPLRYHKRPSAPATAFDIAQGVAVGAWAALRYRVRVVHARSYVPAVMALALKRLLGLKFIFDMRGFWADERVDGGLWPEDGGLYRAAKWFERRFLINADRVVSLTRAAVEEMQTFPYLQQHMPPIDVITTCADLDRFRLASSGQDVDPNGPFTLGYVGSVGVWYLFDDVLRCFRLLREQIPTARFHILNRGGHEYIAQRLAVLGIDPADVRVEAVEHENVARAMQRMDAGIFFYTPTYSKKATAPTKLGEFLGCGVPCLSNSGVGDVASVLEENGVGVALRSFDEPAMRSAVARLTELSRAADIKERCRAVALRCFSLADGVESYRDIYRALLAGTA